MPANAVSWWLCPDGLPPLAARPRDRAAPARWGRARFANPNGRCPMWLFRWLGILMPWPKTAGAGGVRCHVPGSTRPTVRAWVPGGSPARRAVFRPAAAHRAGARQGMGGQAIPAQVQARQDAVTLGRSRPPYSSQVRTEPGFCYGARPVWEGRFAVSPRVDLLTSRVPHAVSGVCGGGPRCAQCCPLFRLFGPVSR